MINHLDEDGDNLVSIDEFRSPRKGLVERGDLNDDGVVTLDELQQHMQESASQRQQELEAKLEEMQSKMAEHFAELDTNGDGSVDAEEAKLAMFNRMDENGDGYLSADEIKRPERRQRRHRKHQDRPMPLEG